MFKRLINLPLTGTESCFLFGPRGTGKTTWLKHNMPEHRYVDLLDQTVYFDLNVNPGHITRYYPQDLNQWIVIDEVQKVPALLNEVHRAIEHEGRRFILTGSSARSLRKKGVNLLAGRALQYEMYPLTALELDSSFDLKRALQYGQLPKAILSADPQKFLKSYVNTYLREEVLQEGLARNMQSFNRFLEIASFSYGQQINMTAIGKEIGVSRETVSNYFDILDDLLIASRLPVFTKRAKRKLVSHPKFYYFDVGVYQITRPKGPLDIRQEINGAALEGLFLQEAKAINAYFELGYDFYFWRTHTQIEVDFVLYGSQGFFAFEIKYRDSIKDSDLKGLKAFKKDYPEARCYMLYLGEQELTINGITVIPIQTALMNLKALLNKF